ncbi:dynein axonemal heavy chain 17-like [Mycteria americana]|uniref:dynein axonemal heavy chain 17-like n=1 Tax=Mycteria americana TaxID=33587 RepID=UPI003F58FA62
MFVMGGKVQGKPLLPLPEHLDGRHDSSTALDCLAGPVDISVLHSIETIVIEWSHQIRDILSKDSAQPLLEGLHPLPGTEFEFWHTRTVNLQCINNQLLSPRVTALAEMLEKANSCYWPALQSMFRDVSAGLEEAKDVSLHLQPLRILLEEMEQADYSQLQPCVDRALCTVRLLRARCQHYSSPAHVIVILQEICNLLVEMTRNFLSPEDVMKGLQGETEEALRGIRLSISTIEKLFQSYSTYCSDLMPTLFPEELQLWEFPPSLVFRRTDSFLHRLKTIEELYQTAIEFLKLEKAELGGVRGNILGSRVFQIYEEVSELIKGFADCRYDPLDPAEEQLNKDFAEFQEKIQDVDRRLATIFCQGFDDCNCLASAVKLVHMFASLLERPLIKAEVSPYYSALLGMFSAELDDVKALYDAQTASPPPCGGGPPTDKNMPPINRNMPPVAGQLKWALELQQRLEGPHRDLFAIDHPVMVSAEARLVSRKYEEMVGLLRGYREKVYEEWACGAGQDCHFSLEQPLIRRDPGSSFLSVNFSKELVAVLREVKYLNFQQRKDIPGSAESLFAQNETFQKFVDNLDLIVGWYNEAGCEGETTQRLLHALSSGQAEAGWGPPRGEALGKQALEAWRGWGTPGTAPAPRVPARPVAGPSCCCCGTPASFCPPRLRVGGVGTPFLRKTRALASASQREQGPSSTRSTHLRTRCPQVKRRLLPVELPLVAGELEAVDGQLASAEHSLFWHHEGTTPPLAARGRRSSFCPRVPTVITPKTRTPAPQAREGG